MSRKYKIMFRGSVIDFVLDDFWYHFRHYMISLELDCEKYERENRYTTSVLRKDIFSDKWEANRPEFEKIWDLRLDKFAKELYYKSPKILHKLRNLDERKLNVIKGFIRDLK